MYKILGIVCVIAGGLSLLNSTLHYIDGHVDKAIYFALLGLINLLALRSE